MNKLAEGLKLIHEHFQEKHELKVDVDVNIFYHNNKTLDYKLAETVVNHCANIIEASISEVGNTLEARKMNNKIQIWYIKETHPDFSDKEKNLYEKLKAKYA